MLARPGATIYLIGIKGTGMSSLAVLLKKMGYGVTGSDTAEKFFTESQLIANDIKYFEGFNSDNIKNSQPEVIILSTAYKEDQPEAAAAKELGLTLLTYPEAVGEISKTLESVAVCGSHGKTTTSSMLGWLMQTNNQTVTLTGTVADQLNKELGQPKYFVFEADEYQNKLRYYHPQNIILTSVDYDHPDFFKTPAEYLKAFSDFVQKTTAAGGFVLFNSDDAETAQVAANQPNTQGYGFNSSADYVITDVSAELDGFSLSHKGETILKTKLGVYGRHNILNASAAAIMALRLGISRQTIQEQLPEFKGVKRRLESMPNDKYIALDDYGHHPTEVRAALAAVRNKYPDKNFVVVFHPHTLSRTKSLLTEFGEAFKDTDLAIILDIVIPSRETDLSIQVHAKDLVEKINQNGVKAIYLPTFGDAAEYIKQNVPAGSVVLTIGAGDVWKMHQLIK